MANAAALQNRENKDKRSPYAILSENGASIEGLVMEIKNVTKQGFGGEEVEALRVVLQVHFEGMIVNKCFDNGSKKWVDEVIDKDIDVGDRIKITRHGAKGSKETFYAITVTQKGSASAQYSNLAPEAPVPSGPDSSTSVSDFPPEF